MKTLFTAFLALAMLSLAAPPPAAADGAYGKSLVIVYSQTGNTMRLAKLIAAKTGSEIYSIEPLEAMPTDEKALIEMEEARKNEGKRPSLKSPPPDLAGYDLIFLGAPTWFGDRPDIVGVFLEAADFKGAKIAVFSSAGTRPGQTLDTLKTEPKNAAPLAPTLLQARADDQSDQAVERKVDDYLAQVAAALKP
jgi:flavodoxin